MSGNGRNLKNKSLNKLLCSSGVEKVARWRDGLQNANRTGAYPSRFPFVWGLTAAPSIPFFIRKVLVTYGWKLNLMGQMCQGPGSEEANLDGTFYRGEKTARRQRAQTSNGCHLWVRIFILAFCFVVQVQLVKLGGLFFFCFFYWFPVCCRGPTGNDPKTSADLSWSNRRVKRSHNWCDIQKFEHQAEAVKARGRPWARVVDRLQLSPDLLPGCWSFNPPLRSKGRIWTRTH